MKIPSISSAAAPYAIVAIALIVCWSGILWSPSRGFVERALAENAGSLAIVAELKLSTNALESIHIPYIGSPSHGGSGMLERAMRYLELSTATLSAQLALLDVVHTTLFKILITALALACLASKLRATLLRFLTLGLLVNPGYLIYLNTVHLIVDQADIELGKGLGAEIKHTSQKHETMVDANIPASAEKADAAPSDGSEKHHHGILGDLLNSTEKLGDDAIRGVKKVIGFVGKAAQRIVMLALHLFVNIACIYVILPLAYLYVLGIWIQRRWFPNSQPIQLSAQYIDQLESRLAAELKQVSG